MIKSRKKKRRKINKLRNDAVIKQVLLELVNKIQPYELLEIRLTNCHTDIMVTSPDAIYPMAIHIKPKQFSTIWEAYRSAVGILSEEDEKELLYEENQSIEFNNKQYVICSELLSVEYFEDYFKIKVKDCEGTSTYYLSYKDICYIRRYDKDTSNLVYNYNKMLYETKTKKE
jgi:hypothetical protein